MRLANTTTLLNTNVNDTHMHTLGSSHKSDLGRVGLCSPIRFILTATVTGGEGPDKMKRLPADRWKATTGRKPMEVCDQQCARLLLKIKTSKC